MLMTKKKLSRMNWTMIFISLAAIFALIATLRQYMENNKLSDENRQLYKKLLLYTTGDENSVPAILTMGSFTDVTFALLNHDTVPMINVKAKCNEQSLPDIGTLYPDVSTRFCTFSIDSKIKSESFDFVVWYNNTKSIYINIKIVRVKGGFLEESEKHYFDARHVEFEHPWQGKPQHGSVIKSNQVYQPNQHY